MSVEFLRGTLFISSAGPIERQSCHYLCQPGERGEPELIDLDSLVLGRLLSEGEFGVGFRVDSLRILDDILNGPRDINGRNARSSLKCQDNFLDSLAGDGAVEVRSRQLALLR